MKFEDYHNNFFNSHTGAFSRVTERENYDSQITLTDVETEIVVNYFGGQNIHIGNVGQNRLKAAKHFKLYNTGEIISLNLVFPKPNNSELRLYLSARAGFKPNGGDVWFLFEDAEGLLNIGHFDQETWHNLGQYDILDNEYSQSIVANSRIETPVENLPDFSEISKYETNRRETYRRDPRVALKRIALSSYTCEIDKSHVTFTSARSNYPFMEAHHLIPMAFQNLFPETSIDHIENIISLCPNCHRAFHYSIRDEKIQLISLIYGQRKFVRSMVSKEQLFGLYNCYEI
jgi:5-methylcytosine-specific restriction protein A